VISGCHRLSSAFFAVVIRACRCDGSVAKRGEITLPGVNNPMPAAALGCLFLAHVFQRVERHLKEAFPNDDVVLIWNIGCPMDHLDEANTKSAWEKMAGVAMELRDRVSTHAALSLLKDAEQCMSSFLPPADSNVFVQPEGLAAVKAFLESPQGAEEKTYAIVDVGAGTTEVSFFFNGGIPSKYGALEPSYLADSTEAVGGGKFDSELAAKWCCDLERARQRKEDSPEQVPYLPSVGVILQQYDRTCRTILRDNKLTAKENKRFDLFIIGGGGRLPVLRDSLTRFRLPGGFVREHTRKLTPPVNLRNGTDVEAHYDLLANACGLASSLDWEYYPPRKVSPMPPPPIGVRRDRDELYPK